MGHYDDCYASDREDQESKRDSYVFQKYKKLSSPERDLVLKVIENIDDFSGFFNVIKLLKK